MKTAVNVGVSYKVIKEDKTDNWSAGQVPTFYETKLFIRKDVPLVLGRGQLNPINARLIQSNASFYYC
jgi:hypothetical protein